MKQLLIGFLVGCVIVAGGTYLIFQRDTKFANERIFELEKAVIDGTNSLLGYTKYTDYLSAGKKSLGEQMKFLAATVTREERVSELLEHKVLWVGPTSRGAVEVTYTVEYSFGYDVTPNSYDIVDGPQGIEIRIDSPIMVAPPAVTGLTNQILRTGWFTDEKVAVIKLYEEANQRAKVRGVAMAKDEAIVALCEKKFGAFLRDFLSKQPGVKRVPAITFTYKTLAPA